MEKRIITISREFGSGGRTVGRIIASKLGIPFYDKELVDQIALESGFAPKFVEENGEHSPGMSRLSYAFAPQGRPRCDEWSVYSRFSVEYPMQRDPPAGGAGALRDRWA